MTNQLRIANLDEGGGLRDPNHDDCAGACVDQQHLFIYILSLDSRTFVYHLVIHKQYPLPFSFIVSL